MRMRVVRCCLPLCLLLLSSVVACGDEESGDTNTNNGASNNANSANNDTNNANSVNNANSDTNNANSVNNANSDTNNANSDTNNANSDTNNANNANSDTNNANNANNNAPVRPACEEAVAGEVDEATYDAYLLPPLEAVLDNLVYVEAIVRKNGSDLTVVVGDDEIPAVFEQGEGLQHCATNPDAAFLKLCFFKSDGSPGAPGALEAVFRPQFGGPIAVLAHRQDLARPCTRAGHYALTLQDATVPDQAAWDELQAGFLQYLSLFWIDGDPYIIVGEEPRVIEPELDDTTGQFSAEFEDLFTRADGRDWDLSFTIQEGSFTLADDGSASVSFGFTVVLGDPDTPDELEFSANASGSRR